MPWNRRRGDKTLCAEPRCPQVDSEEEHDANEGSDEAWQWGMSLEECDEGRNDEGQPNYPDQPQEKRRAALDS